MSRLTTIPGLALLAFLTVISPFVAAAEPAHPSSTSADAPEVLLRKYLEALDRLDMDGAKLIAKQAAEQSHGPVSELMIRHTRLLGARRSETPPKESSRQASAVDRKNALYAVTYNVADLVLPLPAILDPSSVKTTNGPRIPEPDFDSLIDLITTTIKPTTWDTVGGPGSMAPFKVNLSIVVSQTQDVHHEIVELLEQLRRLQDIQIMLDATIVVVPEDVLLSTTGENNAHRDTGNPPTRTSGQPTGEFGAMLGPQQVKRLIEAANKNGNATTLRRITTMNGQQAALSLFSQRGQLQPGVVQAVVSNDRRYVRLTLVLDGKQSMSGSVGDGKTIVVDLTTVTDSPNRADRRATDAKLVSARRLLLLTPRIIIAEEEEEKLGIEPSAR